MSPRDLSPDAIQARLLLMRRLLGVLSSVAEDAATDPIRHLAAERIVAQLVDLAVDINQHVVTTSGSVPTGDYRESFVRAAECGLITSELAARLGPSVGMRNVLVHAYLELDEELFRAAIPRAQTQYGEYIRQVARWLQAR